MTSPPAGHPHEDVRGTTVDAHSCLLLFARAWCGGLVNALGRRALAFRRRSI